MIGLLLWDKADRPSYARSLRVDLVSPEMFDILRAEVCEALTGIPIEMKRGDVLLFTQLTPHGAVY